LNIRRGFRVSPAVARGVAEIDIKTLSRLTIGHSLHSRNQDTEFSVRDFNPIYVWLISLVALGGLLFGDDWVVIGRARPFYEVFFHLTRASQQGWAMSCALLGCLFGALSSGVLSDRLGRKLSLIISAMGFSVSSLARRGRYFLDLRWNLLSRI
jgi:hypothetical protein